MTHFLLAFMLFAHTSLAFGQSGANIDDSSRPPKEWEINLKACGVSHENGNNPGKDDYFEKCQDATMDSRNTAFVFVDFWQSQNDATNEIRIRAAEFLRKLRKNNFYVVMGAGDAVLPYRRYKEFRAEVRKFLGADYCKANSVYGGSNRKEIYKYLDMGIDSSCPEKPEPGYTQKIVPTLAPDETRNKEFLVRYDDEMRYFLWKYKIKNLVYVGGGIDECLLHRPYGLNSLVGSDSSRIHLNIYLVEDLLEGLPTVIPGIDMNKKNEVLLKSLSFKIARIVSSPTFKFPR